MFYIFDSNSLFFFHQFSIKHAVLSLYCLKFCDELTNPQLLIERSSLILPFFCIKNFPQFLVYEIRIKVDLLQKRKLFDYNKSEVLFSTSISNAFKQFTSYKRAEAHTKKKKIQKEKEKLKKKKHRKLFVVSNFSNCGKSDFLF